VKILIVDDDLVQILVLKRMLENDGHQVSQACDGFEAWGLLQGELFELVISDWMMPRMNGPELCRRIRAQAWERYIFVILLTGKSGETDLIEGLSSGADEFLTKPVKKLEIVARLRGLSRIQQAEERLREEKDRSVLAYKALQEDLRLAVKVHRDLFPEPICQPGLEIAWRLHPATMMGGDFLTYHLAEDRYLHVVSADVSGHGLAAALHAVALREALDPRKLGVFPDPAEVVSALNDYFIHLGGFYFTLFYFLLDLQTGSARFCQAGHPSPLLIFANGSEQLLGESGFPVGLLEQATFETETVEFTSSFRLLLFSDGVLDCANGKNEPFGMDRLRDCSRSLNKLTTDQWLNQVEGGLLGWIGDRAFDDDVSLLAIHYDPPAGKWP
jgi:sigma-B regulation protein RsbU (phosphoserine phosphatase)